MLISIPSYNILPDVNLLTPTILLPNVDFPDPDSPTNPKNSPLYIFIDTSSNAFIKLFLFANISSYFY